MFKSHRSKGFLICTAVTLVVLGLFVKDFLANLERRAIDYRFAVRAPRAVSNDLVLVDIDEASIQQMGRWPWPRATHAKMVQKLHKAGAKAVSFDVLFTEKDAANPASDLALGQATADSGIVVAGFHFREGVGDGLFGKAPTMPIAPIESHAIEGFVNIDADKDGVNRHAYLYLIHDEVVYPSLSVATLAVAKGKTVKDLFPELPMYIDQDPLLAQNDIFINYASGTTGKEAYGYNSFSYSDVMSGKVPDEMFKDKIVFVGGTAAALFDTQAVPNFSQYPGVLIHMNAIDNLINRNWMNEVGIEFTFIYVLLVGILLGLTLPRLRPWAKLGVFVAVMAGGVALGFWFFSAKNLIIHMVPPLFTALGCYFGMLFYQLVVEEREKRKIKGSFRQYLSPKIIDVITKDPTKLKLGGEERELSIFFLDIAGFTTMSEALKPTQLVEVMNECLTEFSHIIHKHDGLIDKYIGDCIMAFWNAPADQAQHASQACLAALDCIQALPGLNKRFKEKQLPSIDCRIGINTGTVVVGNMGSHDKFNYTVMGDPVNLASRLEGANKQYHTHIMVSDTTFEAAKGAIEARDIDLIRVKGKREPRKVFEVLCKKGQMTSEIETGRAKYHEALALYRKKEFAEAIATFEEVFHYLPNDYLTRVYLERARSFTANPPPPAWDGVYEMLTK